jgi:hypothetical protein
MSPNDSAPFLKHTPLQHHSSIEPAAANVARVFDREEPVALGDVFAIEF